MNAYPSLYSLSRGGTEVNAIDTLGRTATHYAVLRDNLPALELLLSHGADVNLADNFGNTPLDLWHEHENKEMLALLHSADAKPVDLFQAAANNDRTAAGGVCWQLVQMPKQKNSAGKVPFEIAVEAEYYTLAAILLRGRCGYQWCR